MNRVRHNAADSNLTTPHVMRGVGLLVMAVTTMSIVALAAMPRSVSAHSDEAAVPVSVSTDQPDSVEQLESSDGQPDRRIVSTAGEADAEAFCWDHDLSSDFLTAEFPAAYSADLDFRHVFSHGMTDEKVFAIALPRCIPTAIP